MTLTGFMMGFPNTSISVVAPTNGGFQYDPNGGAIYGVAVGAGALSGFRKWDSYPNGFELRARNLADLNRGSTYPTHCLTFYAKQLVMSPGAANSEQLDGFDMMDMSYKGTFGVTSSSLSNSDHGRILASNYLAAFNDNYGRDIVVATPIRSGAFTGGAEINFVYWGSKYNFKMNIPENAAVLGSIPDGSGSNAWALGYNLGSATMHLYKLGASSNVNGVVQVGAITPQNIDPTWTNVTEVCGLAVDQKDGNVIAGFQTTDVVTNQVYIVKLNGATGAVMWAIPVNGLNYDIDRGALRASTIKNGKFYYVGSLGQLYIIDTIAGTADTSIVIDSGGPVGFQISEDVTGSILWYGGWTEVGLHPNYLGNYCLVQGIHSGSQMVWRYWPNNVFVPPVYGPPVTSRKRAWSFTLDGHTFYVMDLGPNGTYLYDKDTNQWCQFITKGYLNWNFASGCMWGQRIVAGDLLTTDLWELNPGALFDNGATEIVHTVTGGVATRSRIFHSVDSFRLSCSVGQVLDQVGASVTLSFSDDQGETWTTMDTISTVEGNFNQEVAWLSLGAFAAPGRIFKITDSGGFLRIEGADAGIDGFDPATADQGG